MSMFKNSHLNPNNASIQLHLISGFPPFDYTKQTAREKKRKRRKKWNSSEFPSFAILLYVYLKSTVNNRFCDVRTPAPKKKTPYVFYHAHDD